MHKTDKATHILSNSYLPEKKSLKEIWFLISSTYLKTGRSNDKRNKIIIDAYYISPTKCSKKI